MNITTVGKLIIAALVGFFLLGAGYLADGGPPSSFEGGAGPVPINLEAASSKTIVIDARGKIRSPMSIKEYVMIGDRRFEVRPPWLGHRIEGAPEGTDLEFARLPAELVHDNREIYVTAPTRDALVRMADAASLEGVKLLVDSGYRSAAYQKKIFLRKMAEGKDFYDIATGVAPPGYSEHMLGTVVDLVPSKWTFRDTPADKWMCENGAEFGFVQSYPQKSDRGFTWEPWHWKFVGTEESPT